MGGQQLDFIVIGAQKCGTTSLFEYLRGHPEVALPAGKEAPYFSHIAYGEQPWGDYLGRHFPLADPSQKWGTVTPHYMVGGMYDAAERLDPRRHTYDERSVPLRIQQRCADVRLIALLRDPVARARSHHRMESLAGAERRSFDQAVRELLAPEALRDSRRQPRSRTGYVAWGEYGRILTAYFDVFGADRVLVLFTSELERDPQRVISLICGFIGVAADFSPPNLGTRYRQAASARRLSWLNVHAVQQAGSASSLTRRLWHALPERGRRRIDQGFNEIAYRADLWNRRRAAAPAPPPSSDTIVRLQSHYEADTVVLDSLLGAPPPWADPLAQAAPGAGELRR